jgi:hypothetical protein
MHDRIKYKFLAVILLKTLHEKPPYTPYQKDTMPQVLNLKDEWPKSGFSD